MTGKSNFFFTFQLHKAGKNCYKPACISLLLQLSGFGHPLHLGKICNSMIQRNQWFSQ